MATREQVYEALFQLTAPIHGPNLPIYTTSRKAVNWDKVDLERQPALFQIEKSEPVETKKGVPPIFRFEVTWVIYVNPGAAINTLHSTALNDVLDAVQGVLAPPPGHDNQTLGGLVSRVYPGTADIHEGLLGDQVVILLPINIVWPPLFDNGAC